MSKIPEGAETVSVEGVDVRSAVTAAAEKLDIDPKRVGYKLDLSHFRSEVGGSVSRTTVKIIAWAKPEGAEPPEVIATPAPERKPKRSRRDDDDRGDRERKPKKSRSKPKRRDDDDISSDGDDDALGITDASKYAEAWFKDVVKHIDAEVEELQVTGNDERVRIWIKANKAGRIIGRRGATLGAIRHLLALALQEYGDLIVDVDIADDRKKDSGRSKGRGRDDRSSRRSKGRDRSDRSDRGDRDDRRKGGRSKGKGSKFSEEKLQAVARRAAEKALETGRPITVNAPLNSYDRRIVHLEVSEIDGVESQSIVKDGTKYVQILPEAD